MGVPGSMFSGCSFTKGKAILPGKELLTPPPQTPLAFQKPCTAPARLTPAVGFIPWAQTPKPFKKLI